MANLAPPPEAAAPHGAPWAPWGPMGPHGPPWGPMGAHGALWGPYGALWAPHGVPWGPLGLSYGWTLSLFGLSTGGLGTLVLNMCLHLLHALSVRLQGFELHSHEIQSSCE